ncbi:OPT8 oligopeptide transporter [Mucor ambiguus]|uniref:OPT8 oligopeptide transporter n=1 Tax=Mucor ambiguus TaxID=91626 RepID=A0A0C9LT87_9FUNG|nr:OPT8 oligopeptide transporter [Mucor ambiguus]
MYFGLQTGWISMMSLQASLLGFAIFKPCQATFGPKENVYLQTVAVATATMPLAAGFVGIVPALSQLTTTDLPTGPLVLPAWKLILWSQGLAFIGVFFAIPLRKQTIIKEKLKFPSGTATAQMIRVLHNQKQNDSAQDGDRLQLQTFGQDAQEDAFIDDDERNRLWSLKLKALLSAFSVSSIYTLASYFFPLISALPVFNWITLNYIDFKSWEWYFTPSLSYVGQGIIMATHYAEWAPGPINDWRSGSKGWILWISLGVMISESIVSLLIVLIKQLSVMVCSYKAPRHAEQHQDLLHNQDDLDEDDSLTENSDLSNSHVDQDDDLPATKQVPIHVAIVGFFCSVALCVVMVKIVFGSDIMPEWMTIVSIILAMFLSILGVRALGETDLNPVSGISKLSQIAASALMPGAIVANLIAGGIAEASAQQAGDLMQDLKTGYLLQASPKAQFYGQLIGSLISSFVATGAYLLYTSVYSIPGPEFPAPTAQVWLDMARLVNGHPLSPHVLEFVIAFSVLFAILTFLKETRKIVWHQWIPQGIAFAIGIYNPPNFTLARVIGGILCHLWDGYIDGDQTASKSTWLKDVCKPYRDIGKVAIIIVASGFVLGEGTFAIVNMLLHALNVPHL